VIGDGNRVVEQGLTRFLLGNRDRIREMKRRYLEELFLNNNQAAAEKINREHIRLFGKPIEIKSRDEKNIQARLLLTRTDKILTTLPPELRGQFQTVAATAFSGALPGFFGTDPATLGVGQQSQRLAASASVNAPAPQQGGFGFNP